MKKTVESNQPGDQKKLGLNVDKPTNLQRATRGVELAVKTH